MLAGELRTIFHELIVNCLNIGICADNIRLDRNFCGIAIVREAIDFV